MNGRIRHAPTPLIPTREPQERECDLTIGTLLDGRVVVTFSTPTQQMVMTPEEAAEMIRGLQGALGVGLVG